MAKEVICWPPYIRMTAENKKAMHSEKIEKASFAFCGIRSTKAGIFICPRSLVTRLAPKRAIQANR